MAAASSACDFAPAKLRAGCSFEEFCESYASTQAVLIKGCVSVQEQSFGLDELSALYARWPEMVQQTFSLEYGALSNVKRKGHKRRKLRKLPEATACEVLGPDAVRRSRWYASFIVQDPKALKELLKQLPCSTPPFFPKEQSQKLQSKLKGKVQKSIKKRRAAQARASAGRKDDNAKLVSHNKSAWLFFGQNNHNSPMPGRPEHTDKMKHHGTWHVQLSGSKVWYLRATSELLEAAGMPDARGEEMPRHAVQCDAGDMLVVNTRLWWHSTKLPSLYDSTAGPVLSLSYARDFVISDAASGPAAAVRKVASAGLQDDEPEDEEEEAEVDMNVDGMLAKESVKKGSVIMRADEMPRRDKRMCVPAAPNCMVRDMGDGSGEALVAVKDIASGDLFLVLGFESDDEDPQLQHMRTFAL